MEYRFLTMQREGRVLTIGLNRPPMNALGVEFGRELFRAFTEAGQMEEVTAFANELASGAGKAMGSIKAAVHEGIALPMEQALAVERRYGLENLGSHDAKEGLAAFAERRKPDFQSR